MLTKTNTDVHSSTMLINQKQTVFWAPYSGHISVVNISWYYPPPAYRNMIADKEDLHFCSTFDNGPFRRLGRDLVTCFF